MISREEAIGILSNNAQNAANILAIIPKSAEEKAQALMNEIEALDMAIELLKDDWIPVSKELPKESAFYEVTFELMEGLRLCQCEFFDAEKQIWFIPYRVIAWRERHKPYKGE